MNERIDHDILQRFIFEKHQVKGALIHLRASYQAAYSRHNYGLATQEFLGQMLAAVGLLASTIKFKGRLTLQLQSEGNVKLLLAQADNQLHLRGLAMGESDVITSFREAVGKGNLLISIDQANAKQRFQAITAVTGETLSDTLEHYFMQSEQLPTRIWLLANETRAAGLILQKLPKKDDDSNFWSHIETLAQTITKSELLNLANIEILHRLFHEEDVRLFDEEPVSFRCSCSQEKMEAALRQFRQEELNDIIKKEGKVSVTCDFCNRCFEFDLVDIAKVFSGDESIFPGSDETQ